MHNKKVIHESTTNNSNQQESNDIESNQGKPNHDKIVTKSVTKEDDKHMPKKIYKPKWFRELQDPANPQIVKVARSITTNAFTSNERKNEEKNAKNSKVSEDIPQVVQKSSSKFENSRQNKSKITYQRRKTCYLISPPIIFS